MGWFFLVVCETQFVFKEFRTLVDHKNRDLNNSRYCCMYRFKVNLGLSWPTLVQNYHLKIILHFLFSWRTNSGAYAQQVLVCNCSDWFFKISISHNLYFSSSNILSWKYQLLLKCQLGSNIFFLYFYYFVAKSFAINSFEICVHWFKNQCNF